MKAKENSQGIVKTTGESYIGKDDGKEHAKFITVGEAFDADPKAEGGARGLVRLMLLPFPQPGTKGRLLCWLQIFPEDERTERKPKEKFKLTGIVKSGGLQIGAEFTSPSGKRTIKLEASPIPRMYKDGSSECVLQIFDLPQEKASGKDVKHESKRNRKDS